MARIIIDKDLCTGCGSCISACLYDALELNDDGVAVVDADKCNICRACVSECPFEAISVEGAQNIKDDKDDYHGIWVYAEQWDGKLHDVAFELLTEARQLSADLGEDLSAVLIGHNVKSDAAELNKFGANNIYLFDDSTLAIPNEETYAYLMADLITKYKPAVVLYGATAFGRSLAPRIAAKLNTGLTADCTFLSIDKERKLLQQTRPAFGGNVMATILCPEHRPQMATVRPKVFKKEALSSPEKCNVIIETVNLNDFEPKSHIIEVVGFQNKELRVEDAEIVVAGGAGFACQEDFALTKELADLLGGCVGASRAAVDAGYASHPNQVGQTGKVIAPKIYIACGIAGAIQHLVGMENSDFIIAINNDPDASIFQIADIGIVGDVKVVLPKLIEKIKSHKAKQLAV
ncbi:MAG: electron transfer flavoprotein subunit alpha [Desulfitobacteriaceae bacterium]|nr:electron transfer flavoprotein subunit alpha [Desulfitobacteriaceae bacterium]